MPITTPQKNKLDAKQMRESNPTSEELAQIERKPIYIIIDNVLDTYNTGSIFRLAEAMAVSGIYLVGRTDVPTDPKVGHKVQKASVGTWKWVPWKHADTIAEAVVDINSNILESFPVIPEKAGVHIDSRSGSKMTQKKLQLVAIEQDERSISHTECDYKFPLALIVGHETTGVSDEGMRMADHIVEIPMHGVNTSLNVMVSLAIVLWEVGRK